MRIDDLRLEIDASRKAVRQDYAALRAELDFTAKTKAAIVRHPLPFLGSAAALGFLFSGRGRRKARKGGAEPAKRFTLLGLLLTLGRLLFPIAQPYLAGLAARQLSGLAAKIRR